MLVQGHMGELLDVFHRTLDKSNCWLDELRSDLGLADRQHAYRTLRAVLHALRDRLSIEEVADLGAQLPLLLRGMYFEGWRPARRRARVRRQEQFLALVCDAYGPLDHLDAAKAVAAVFKLLARHVTGGEIDDVRHGLPRDLKRLWPAELRIDG